MSRQLDGNKIFVIRYKDSYKYVKNGGGLPLYVDDCGFPTADVGNAEMFSRSIDAYRKSVYWKLDKDTIVEEV